MDVRTLSALTFAAMYARRILLCTALALLVALVPAGAHAQLDDFLEPLTPAPKQSPRKKKAPRKVAPKRKKAPPPQEDLFAEPLVRTGTLWVTVAGPEDGVLVTVNGEPIPAGKKVEVEAGAHALEVKRAGWTRFSRMVNVEAGQVLTLPVALDPVAGVLSVRSDVAGSAVLVDGKQLGTAPLSEQLIPPGMHEVIVRRDGFEDHVSRLAVRAGRDYSVTANLRPLDGDRPMASRLLPDSTADTGVPLHVQDQTLTSSPAWYGRWYVWAGAAAVAAVVTGAVVVANNNSGTTHPQSYEICGRECDAVMNAPVPSAVGRF